MHKGVLIVLRDSRRSLCGLKIVTLLLNQMNNIVDIRTERNFEIAMRLHTDVNNEAGEFYTDLNGFQMIKRQYFEKLPLQVIPFCAQLNPAV